VDNASFADDFLSPATAQVIDASIHALSASSPLPPASLQLSPPLAIAWEASPLSPVVSETLILGQHNATLAPLLNLQHCV
jgi:hypothetical protein